MSALASSMATAIRSSGLPLSDLGGLIFHLQSLLRSDGSRQFSTREIAANIDFAITIARRRDGVLGLVA
ncbi:hypothetical protein ACN6KF_003019 [Labrys sp. La1]|uniref:hypothetical protein n=1 Tax=Labrys sp. La1 TaxID=3404917 RepID=UPI003EBFB0C1